MSRTAVVIPSYNHEPFIGDAVKSVLDQTRRPDRLIVVDDGSSDGSLNALAGFRGKANVEIVEQTNLGAHNAINRGIRLACEDCDYVAVLNSDDVFEKGRIEACLQYLESNQDHSVVCSRFALVDGEGKPLTSEHPRARWFRAAWSPGMLGQAELPEWLGTANFLGTTSNIFARTSYLKAHPFRAFRYGHDYFFFSKAVLDDKLGLLRSDLLRYRVHGANTMNTDPSNLVREMVRIQLELYREIGYEAMAQPGFRERFQGYARATWGNVSAFHAGIFQSLLARICSSATDDVIQEALVVLGELDDPEFHDYPNKALVNSFDGETPLGAGTGLADKFEKLRTEHRALKEDMAKLREVARIRQKLLASKRVALGAFFGRCSSVATDRGKTPSEKLHNLRDAIKGTRWLKGREF